jgi:hypothetical protein
VRERVWQQRWDLVIIDEAHKCSAYTKSAAGRADEIEKTKRHQLAERLTAIDVGLFGWPFSPVMYVPPRRGVSGLQNDSSPGLDRWAQGCPF